MYYRSTEEIVETSVEELRKKYQLFILVIPSENIINKRAKKYYRPDCSRAVRMDINPSHMNGDQDAHI